MMNEHQMQLIDALSDMRITVEGMLALYDEDAAPLYDMAKKAQLYKVAAAFYAIGKALFTLRESIMQLEATCHAEAPQKA